MKRVIAILCALILLLSMAACGAPTSDSADTQGNTNEITSTEATEPPAQEIAFSEVIAVDNEYCTIKITSIEPDSLFGYTLKAYMENKTADQTLMFSVDSASVNGVMADPFFASEIAAGKKSNEEITFMGDSLEVNGITDFTDIELNFRVYDSNDWSADAVAEETVHVYPYGEEKATAFTRQPQSSDTILVDNEYATVIVTGYTIDDLWGYTANLYIVNKTDTVITVSVDEVSVNGFMADPFYADSVNSGKCAFSSISWSDSTFEENGITEVETIEFVLRVYDSNDWMADDFANELITLNP